jgi:putative heme-binding domain-containing protein
VRTFRVFAVLGLLTTFAFATTAGAADPPRSTTPQWIAAEAAKDAPKSQNFRRAFALPDDVQLDYADLFVAGTGKVSIYLNGAHIGDARGRERLVHYPVLKRLKPGPNVFALKLEADGDVPPAVIASLRIVDQTGAVTQIVTDKAWRTASDEIANFAAPDFDDTAWKAATSLGPLGTKPWGAPTSEVEHYHQWKQAIGTGVAADPRTIDVPQGLAVELIRSAGPDEGSWIGLEFDPKGRLLVAREDKGLMRLTLPEMPRQKLAGEAAARAIRVETINDTLLECRGLLFVENDLFAMANNSKGLYRLRDTNGDDEYDEVKLLREMPGNVGHGRNDLTLGPDGRIYLICGNDVLYPSTDQPDNSPFRNFQQDRLLPCAWNKYLFNSGTPAPGGYVVRTDREGKTWEILAAGFRNAYGVAFNDDGELFTFDADMEWDAGAPWYRPTRINHVVSGGDYGWRQGVDKWRAWYPDSLPSNLDVGLSSPTAVKFVPPAFSHNYASQLLALDWAFGRILLVGLQPDGASYRGVMQPFISGRPLNVCDVAFGPDGGLYFVTGGRRTQSGIYRVVELPNAPPCAGGPPNVQAIAARKLRRSLEQFHGRQDPKAIETAWQHLGSDDPWIRHAARVAVEAQPVAKWQARALAERDLAKAATALLALARCAPPELQAKLLARLGEFVQEPLDAAQQIAVLRAYQLALFRDGEPEDEKTMQVLREQLEPLYPANTVEANDLLCELLVYLRSPVVIERTLPLIDAAATPEEKLHYLHTLRLVKGPWTPAQREAYFTWLLRAEEFPGAHAMPKFLAYIKQDAVATLSAQEKLALQKLLEPPQSNATDEAPRVPRPFVKAWTLDDFIYDLATPRAPLDKSAALELFRAADCAKCHRAHGEGSLVGPELSALGKRFSKQDILLSILDPSRVIDDKHKQQTIVTTRGVTYTGQVAAADDQAINVITDPSQPTKTMRIARVEIEQMLPSTLSPMPAGLLNTLSKEEVLGLLDFLSRGEGE